MKLWKQLAGTAGLVTALSVALSTAVALNADEKAKVGEKAPNFTLKTHEGEEVSLSDYEGKIVVLEWFNHECPFVVKFYRNGDMNEMVEKYKEQDVVWLAVNSSSHHDAEENKRIAEEWSIGHPILVDADGTVGRKFGARTTPHVFIIDKEGTLAYAGAIDSIRSTSPDDISKADNFVQQALDELLAEETVSNAETQPYGCSVKY